jgi:GntR family transcriptional regulator, transcriptional repressor for pyruvate dehydrogenase complex
VPKATRSTSSDLKAASKTKAYAAASSSKKKSEDQTGVGAGGPKFQRVRTQRVFEAICDQVRSEMAAGTLRPGDKLPAERDLALKFQVSRSAVREALRSLEVAGVVGLAKGVNGGAFILEGDPTLVTRSIQDMYHLGRIPLSALTEARTLVMQMALPLTAERMKPALIAALERNVDQLASLPRTGSMPERLSLGFEFYSLIAQAADNAVIQVIVESLTEILLRQVEKSKVGPLPDLIAHRRRLVGFLANGQTENATREMTDHLQRLHKYLIKEERLSVQQRASNPEKAVSTTASRQSKPSVATAKR